jgi:collagenase-like PrtC family protease
MRLSVPCNFDDALIDQLDGYPVYEVFGKVTTDYAGGGRPSFYLPKANKSTVERFVKKAHDKGIEFNYLINASCMGNAEYTREGNQKIRETLDWVDDIGVDSVTVGQIYLLQLVKRCYPRLKVRISAHRFTDSARKARFWEDHGADCIVLNETAFAREFKALEAIRNSVSCDLSLIVNNSCRQDCAIAATHACSLSHGSQKRNGKTPLALDYHMLFCLEYRLREPVNYIRANWIRPEDLHHYESMGFTNFKIVERNTPTPELLRRVHAYANRSYSGNFLDLVLPFQYPESSYASAAAREAFSLRRAMKYLFKPSQVNVTKVPKLAALGRRMGLLYPRRGESPLQLDNRKLDGFIDRFLDKSCIDTDCEKCRYCHRVAEEALTIDPEYRQDVLSQYQELFEDMHGGRFWETPSARDLVDVGRLVWKTAQRSARERLTKASSQRGPQARQDHL